MTDGPGDRFSPIVHAVVKLYPLKGTGPYTAFERAVVMAIVRRMKRTGTQSYTSYPSYDRIARDADVSVATVKRILERHCNGPNAIVLKMPRPKQPCLFSLVTNAAKCLEARDAGRAMKLIKTLTKLDDDEDFQRDKLDLQRLLLKGLISQAEYDRRLDERQARAGVPRPVRRAMRAAGCSSHRATNTEGSSAMQKGGNRG
jgi:hypothetical protein